MAERIEKYLVHTFAETLKKLLGECNPLCHVWPLEKELFLYCLLLVIVFIETLYTCMNNFAATGGLYKA